MSHAVKLVDCRKGLTWADVAQAYSALFGGEPAGLFLVFVPGSWVSVRK